MKDISHILEDDLTQLKTKLKSTCSKIQVPYKYTKIIDRLSKSQSICIMKEEKGCTVAVMYKSKYIEKSLHVLQSEQFTKLRYDPTKSIENKKQRELSKLKTRLTM